MKKITVLLIALLFILSVNGQGAIEKKRQLSDKIFFGGGLGLQFGYITAIEVMPIVGYKPIDDLYLGVKGKFEYYKHSSYSAGTTIYGGSVFGMYSMFDFMVAYAEYEILSLESTYFNYYTGSGDEERFLIHTPLIGGGVVQSLGGRSKLMLLLLWNFNDTYAGYYSNPIIRVSFLF